MILQLALRNLFRNTRRTMAILLTVAMGSGSLFIFTGFNTGITHEYAENTIHSRYGYGQINTLGYRDQVFEKPWQHWMTDWKPLEKRLKEIPGVHQLFPRVSFFALLSNGRVNVSGRGEGIDAPAEAKFFNTLNIEQGKNLGNDSDGIILGLGLAHALGVKPGDRVTVLTNTIDGSMNGGDFIVSGIFHTGMKYFDDSVFRISLAQAHTLLDTDRIESVSLGLGSMEDFPRVAQIIKKEFPKLEATPFAVLDKVFYQNSVDWLNSQFVIIKSIILVMVILGIFNTVSSGILERKQEIGNLRANGESELDVMKLLVSEGAILGLAGGAAGVLLVWFLNSTALRNGFVMPPAPGITRVFHIHVELHLLPAITSFFWGAFTAVLGTVMASWKVVKIPIAEALRSV